jgi:hypothetical protein
MSVWFDGSNDIDCDIRDVKRAFEDYGDHYVGVIGLMPGMTSVELVEQSSDSVTIRTNEGLMKRTGISKRNEADSVIVEFDEQYETGSSVTTTSHFFDEFTSSGGGVTHRLVMSDIGAPGFLGFFYRRFGSSKMGNAFLTAYKAYFET